MSNFTRRGRPPKVTTADDGTMTVKVKGTFFRFRSGRPVQGTNHEHEEYAYAKSVVDTYRRMVEAAAAEADLNRRADALLGS